MTSVAKKLGTKINNLLNEPGSWLSLNEIWGALKKKERRTVLRLLTEGDIPLEAKWHLLDKEGWGDIPPPDRDFHESVSVGEIAEFGIFERQKNKKWQIGIFDAEFAAEYYDLRINKSDFHNSISGAAWKTKTAKNHGGGNNPMLGGKQIAFVSEFLVEFDETATVECVVEGLRVSGLLSDKGTDSERAVRYLQDCLDYLGQAKVDVKNFKKTLQGP